ncbi:tyrosine-protein phosphatase non-receptor type 23-like [Amyelois transitella]|uniref:tyrosine-protein phosphatase non-receptor type 23-like n=1 Tax=Amyelois transitella TaxID=680683 RepID=UPI00298FB528|nr:tyrosine-protein phosphatase non-receptor type 23-like [Amyelois transitella]
MVHRAFQIAVVLCVCMSASADVAHLKAAKSRLAAKLIGHSKHHKRGILSPVPPFKLGYDIPHVTHSVVKPLVVTYPPTASVTAVKVPLAHPLAHRYPVPVGHKVPVPHPHYGLKFPHTKTVLVPKPDHHFHHHHHHLEPKPLIPVVPADPHPPTPIVPIAQPTGNVVHPIPAPPPVVVRPETVLPAHHIPVGSPPIPLLPQGHIDVKPFLPAAPVSLQPAGIPLPPAPVVPAPAPIFPLTPQYPYVIRPGNAVQTSYFATYPRYPLLNYNTIFPLQAPVAPAPVGPVLYDRPAVPSLHLVPQAATGEGVLEQQAPTVHLEPTPNIVHPTQAIPHPTLHLQPTQPSVHLQPTQPAVHLQPTQPAIPFDHNGWSPVPPHDIASTQHTDTHYPQAHDSHHFTQQQGTQVYEQHTNEDQQYHDLHNLQHHIQHQIDQAQYEQHLNNQHQLSHEYGVPQQINHEYSQPNQDFSQHDYSQHGHDFSQQQAHDYAQQAQDYAQQAQDYAQHAQDYAQHAHEQQYDLQQPGQEYGLPHAEGRSEDTAATSATEGEDQRYHNHIPLGLQLPLERPLDHFR